MFKRILFPTDGTAASLHTAKKIAELAAEHPDTYIRVIVVIAPREADKTDLDVRFVQEQNENMVRQAECALEEAAHVFAARNVRHSVHIVEGDPPSAAIAREAAEGDYDLIAMGSRELKLQKDDIHYTGSVTEHVIRRVSIPVLVIPAHE